MDFFQYKDFNDFITKMRFTTDHGLEFLENELEKRSVGNGKYMEEKPRI